jgi:hypothetical protein
MDQAFFILLSILMCHGVPSISAARAACQSVFEHHRTSLFMNNFSALLGGGAVLGYPAENKPLEQFSFLFAGL